MANIEGKTDAALEWAKGWSHLDGYLKLNALINEDGDATLTTTYDDAVIQKYIDGTAVRQFTFQLRVITSWSDGYDSTNIEAMKLATSWLDWVNEQYEIGNIPDFGDAEITSIEADQNTPALNKVDQDESLAEYLIQAVITYIE